MIILDTNVISELMRPQPDLAVFEWVAKHPRETLYTTYINEAEIFYGVSAMPQGRRRDGFFLAADTLFNRVFSGRVLPFGGPAARRYGEIVAARRALGRPIEAFDALIAAVASEAGAAVATRDTGGFSDCGLEIINPWNAER